MAAPAPIHTLPRPALAPALLAPPPPVLAPPRTAQQGVVTFGVDPNNRSMVTDAWWNDIKALGVSLVRIPIYCDGADYLPLDMYTKLAASARRAGIAIVAALGNDFCRPWLTGNPSRMMYPNEALGYSGNKRQNRYIKEFAVRAGRVARALAPYGLSRYYIWNEPNLKELLPIGANVPPVAGDKAPALAPEVYASLCYEVCGYLKANGATEVSMGALSWIAGGGADVHNPYGAGYLNRALDYLKSTHVTRLPFDALALNSEGYWTAAAATKMAGAVAGCFTSRGFTPLPLGFGEWGVRAGDFAADRAAETYEALAAVCGTHMMFFSHPSRTPNLLSDFAATLWATNGPDIVVVGQRTPWWGFLHDRYTRKA